MKFPARILLTMILSTTLWGEDMKPAFKRSEVVTETSEFGARIDRFTLYSPSMKRDIRVVVVLPEAYQENPTDTFPVLYTLHGRSAPYDTWVSMPSLLKQLKKTPFIYATFDGDNNSFYLDSPMPVQTARKKEPNENDPQLSLFQTFFFDEFIPAIDNWYRTNPQARGVTGFSMGGNGALHYTLQHPEMFCASSGLSSAITDFSDPGSRIFKRYVDLLGPVEEHPERYQAIDQYVRLNKLLAEGVQLPPMYQHIGTEDHLLEENRKFRDFSKAKGLDLTYEESPGEHNWKFWNAASVGVAEFHWEHFQRALSGAETP